MDQAAEYIPRADECVELARTAPTEEHRRKILEIADAWRALSEQRHHWCSASAAGKCAPLTSLCCWPDPEASIERSRRRTLFENKMATRPMPLYDARIECRAISATGSATTVIPR